MTKICLPTNVPNIPASEMTMHDILVVHLLTGTVSAETQGCDDLVIRAFHLADAAMQCRASRRNLSHGYLLHEGTFYGELNGCYASTGFSGGMVFDEGDAALPPDEAKWIPASAAPYEVRRRINPHYTEGVQ